MFKYMTKGTLITIILMILAAVSYIGGKFIEGYVVPKISHVIEKADQVDTLDNKVEQYIKITEKATKVGSQNHEELVKLNSNIKSFEETVNHFMQFHGENLSNINHGINANREVNLVTQEIAISNSQNYGQIQMKAIRNEEELKEVKLRVNKIHENCTNHRINGKH